jgi:hypothetical protein
MLSMDDQTTPSVLNKTHRFPTATNMPFTTRTLFKSLVVPLVTGENPDEIFWDETMVPPLPTATNVFPIFAMETRSLVVPLEISDSVENDELVD